MISNGNNNEKREKVGNRFIVRTDSTTNLEKKYVQGSGKKLGYEEMLRSESDKYLLAY